MIKSMVHVFHLVNSQLQTVFFLLKPKQMETLFRLSLYWLRFYYYELKSTLYWSFLFKRDIVPS